MSRIEFRSDKGQLRKFETTGGGGIRVDAALTRVGVFEYLDADGNVSRELKSPQTVFDQAALESLRDAPVTIEHPSEFVDPWNWKDHAIGHVSGVPGRDPDKADTVVGPLVIQDASAIQAIDAGELKEVSLGYFAEIEDSPGIFEGQEYDRVQRVKVYNHVAIGGAKDWGRLGPEIALRINRHDGVTRCDGSASQVAETITPKPCTARQNNQPKARRHAMSIISVDKGAVRIDGVPHEPDDRGQQALQIACDRARKDATEETASAVNEQIRVAEAAFALARQNAELKAELDRIKSVDVDAEIESRANARADLIAKASQVAPGIEVSGKSNAEIVDAALAHVGIQIPDGASEEYKRGRLDSIEAKPETRQDASALGGTQGSSSFDAILAAAEAKRNNSLNGRGA